LNDALNRIADALDRLAPKPYDEPDFSICDAFLWQCEPQRLVSVPNVSGVDIDLLLGIDQSRDTLRVNTEQFAKGFPANNALLWGARGMGKSSLVKAVHGIVKGIILIEYNVRIYHRWVICSIFSAHQINDFYYSVMTSVLIMMILLINHLKLY